jgi:pyruvate kinase
MNDDSQAFSSLIEELTALRAEMLREEYVLEDRLRDTCEEHRESASNLAHYVALRRHDIRDLQERLTANGLSSLGRAEADVLGAFDALLRLLHRLADGRQYASEANETAEGLQLNGWDLLERNTEALLGPPPKHRNVRIMVTMPSEAAIHFGLVRDLLLNGMNCMRVNCAHDGPEEWAAMISNLKRAILETGLECRVLMDLGGPKLRTGPLQPGPAVLKYSPRRDAYGRVISPARIFLTPAREPQTPSTPVDACVPVPVTWLAKLGPGDRIKFTDARGASRSMRVTEIDGKNRWAEGHYTSYLIPGTVLEAVYAKSSPHAGSELQARVGDLPRKPEPLVLRRGDTLEILRSSAPGRTPVHDQQGQLLSPPTIGVAQPDFLDHVRVGERIKLDDGKIGGIIRGVDPDKIKVEIVQARAKGSRLRAEKGINLPESELRVSPLTTDDIKALDFVAKNADMLGYSFVRTESDIRDLQSRLEKLGAEKVGIILKIETRQGFEQLPSLLLAAMHSPRIGVMIARGDLAVECGYQRLAEVQEEILWMCEAAHVPVIWATQVLESLAKEGVPSRSEITDAAAGVRAECVMLNKGPYIVNAVRALDDILRRMEGHQRKSRSTLRKLRLAELFQTSEHSDKLKTASSAI